MQSDANTRGTRILTRSPHQQHDCGCRLHSDGHSMDGEDDTTLVREQQALSFNPFGDELELEANAADRDEADEVTHRLAHLSIPSPVHGVGGYTSSNASSAVSTHTNPLFDGAAVVDASLAGGQAASPKQSASTTTAAAAGFFLNPTADSYAPPAVSSSTSSPLYKRTPSSGSGVVSLIAGAGQAPSSVRRHRLSSASSVKSTRSRRSTNSSISSIASKLLPQSHSDADASSFDVAAGSPAGVVADSNASQQPPGITRPITRTSNSQESMISLQPSVMSLETTARSPPPVAGYRIPATGSLRHSSFPQLSMCGPAFKDFDSHPIYVCSAILGTAIHPAKAGPHLSPPVRMSFAGKEILHEGRYDLLPITPDMKWYDASDGRVPEGRQPIQAGYEESGEQLHHALARIQGFWVPGKTGTHLKGANFPFAGREVRMRDGYKILCWRRREGSIADSEATEVPPSHHHVIDNYIRTPGPP